MTEDSSATYQADIRRYAEIDLWPTFPFTDKEDLVTVLELLLVTKLLDNVDRLPLVRRSAASLYGLYNNKKQLKWFVDFEKDPLRELRENERITFLSLGMSSRSCITFLSLGMSSRSCPIWNFQSERAVVLLSKLEFLDELVIHRNGDNFRRLFEVTSRLPNLKSLSFICKQNLENVTPRNLVRELGDPHLIFSGLESSNLEEINLGAHYIGDETELETLLFEVFPYLPKLRKFSVCKNSIKSLQGIAFRILDNRNNEASLGANSRLRRINLGYSGGWARRGIRERLAKDPNEVQALKIILNTYRELNEIKGVFGSGASRLNVKEFDPSIAYLMEINFIGRILVQPERDESTTAPPIDSPIPLSAWPVVLTRTWKQEFSHDLNADGVYYLLRNVPILQQRNNRNLS